MDAKILIVEDEGLVAYYIRKVLESLGYNTPAIVATGEEALAVVETMRPDLVLMDILLGGDMDGIETAERIQAKYNTPIIYLTGYDDKLSTERAQMTQPLGCILKPFRINELRITVEMAFYRGRMEKALRESESRFRSVLDLMSEALVVLDKSHTITMLNEQFVQLSGFGKDELIGKNLRDLSGYWDCDLISKHIMNGSPETRRRYEMDCRSKTGRNFRVLVSSKIMRDNEGEYQGVIKLLLDLTEPSGATPENTL